MNQMNIAGMNVMPGGPVGGGMPMMNANSSAPRSDPPASQEVLFAQLNTYIYDYFLKRGQFDIARAIAQNDSVKLNTEKPSPGNRREGEVNGADDASANDKDEKMKLPDDLPRPSVPMNSSQSFLFDWFSLFWDVFLAHRKKGGSPQVQQYLQQTQVRRFWSRIPFDLILIRSSR